MNGTGLWLMVTLEISSSSQTTTAPMEQFKTPTTFIRIQPPLTVLYSFGTVAQQCHIPPQTVVVAGKEWHMTSPMTIACTLQAWRVQTLAQTSLWGSSGIHLNTIIAQAIILTITVISSLISIRVYCNMGIPYLKLSIMHLG